MKPILLLVLCCVCGNFGEGTVSDVFFNIRLIENKGVRSPICETTPKEIVVAEDQTVLLAAELRGADKFYRVNCSYNNGTGFREFGAKHYDDQEYHSRDKKNWSMSIDNVKKYTFGTWKCRFGFNKFDRYAIKPYSGEYTFENCIVAVKGSEEIPEPTKAPSQGIDMQTIYIIIGVGVPVLLIIIAQTIALCYFKRKANPRRRMDKMTSRSRFDRDDRARYSAPPCRKGSKASARAQADTDSHIYEMVGVNALYKESSELNQEIRNDTSARSIKDRPPLPLPHEIPEPVSIDTLPRPKAQLKSMPSTHSLLSTTSSNNTLTSKKKPELPPAFKKAPARPPKPADDDLPGSLKRAPKALPSPAVAPKTGSMPKMPANDPALIELKNAFKKRNVGNNSPAPSPTATLEKKPPKCEAKPNKKQLKQEKEAKPAPPQKQPPFGGFNPLAQPGATLKQPKLQEQEPKNPIVPQKQPPVGGFNPLAPPGPNQIRLILPKIEASLKQPPKPVPVPPQNPIKPGPAPAKKPKSQTPMSQPTSMSHPTPMTHPAMSQVPPQNRPYPTPTPVSHLPSQFAPVSQPAPSPLQSRPLPMPQEAPAPPRPLPPRPLPPSPSPPIYQTADEDIYEEHTPATDDEEEWTYEQLEKYNIYNM